MLGRSRHSLGEVRSFELFVLRVRLILKIKEYIVEVLSEGRETK